MDKEEKVMEEKNPMGLVQALVMLHEISDHAELMGIHSYTEAFRTVFCWIDEMILLLKKTGGGTDELSE